MTGVCDSLSFQPDPLQHYDQEGRYRPEDERQQATDKSAPSLALGEGSPADEEVGAAVHAGWLPKGTGRPIRLRQTQSIPPPEGRG